MVFDVLIGANRRDTEAVPPLERDEPDPRGIIWLDFICGGECCASGLNVPLRLLTLPRLFCYNC